MMVPRLRVALLITALVCAAGLGAALAAELWGGLVPCALCLVERWPYRGAIALALIGTFLPRALARLTAMLIVLVLLGGVGIAAVHVGVERKAWPSPLPECAAPRLGGGSLAERLARMPDKPAKPCDEPTYLTPAVPLSLAEMNLLFGLGTAAGVAIFLWRSRRSAP